MAGARKGIAPGGVSGYYTPMRACAFCGHVLDDSMEIFRSSTCPGCGRDLKVCLNCRFYRPGSHWDCLETIQEPVAEKDRSNYCEFFRFKSSAPAEVESRARDTAKDAFNKLFGDAG